MFDETLSNLDVAELGYDTYGVRHIERLGADKVLHLEAYDLGPMLLRALGNRSFTTGGKLLFYPKQARNTGLLTVVA